MSTVLLPSSTFVEIINRRFYLMSTLQNASFTVVLLCTHHIPHLLMTSLLMVATQVASQSQPPASRIWSAIDTLFSYRFGVYNSQYTEKKINVSIAFNTSTNGTQTETEHHTNQSAWSMYMWYAWTHRRVLRLFLSSQICTNATHREQHLNLRGCVSVKQGRFVTDILYTNTSRVDMTGSKQTSFIAPSTAVLLIIPSQWWL